MGLGASALVGIGTAAASTGMALHSSAQQKQTAAKARRLQQDQISKQEGLQKKQLQLAETEKLKLQVEESDAIRASRGRGRRSLIAGNEQGVDTLGQRIGGL